MNDYKKTLSIIVPVYNEANTIASLLDRTKTVELPVNKEIIIVNDGSTDASCKIIERWLEQNPNAPGRSAKLLHKENGGKGSAVRKGIENSTGDVVIIQDGDLEYDPNDYRQCIEPILNGEAKVVYGSRELAKKHRSYSYATFFMGGLMVTNWMNLLFGSELTDEPTCYKTFDGLLIRTLLFKGDGFEWEPEITAKLLRLGYKIKETGISYAPRKMEEGKKINWKDGVKALWTALIWRLKPIAKEKQKLADLPEEIVRFKIRKKQKTAIYALLAFCFLMRLMIAIPGIQTPEQTFSRPDTGSYLNPAIALAETGKYETAPNSEKPATLRPPGFSVALAAILTVSAHNLKVAVIILCLISSLICLPVFYTGKLLGGFAVGVIAAVLFALNITAIAAAPMLLSDSIFCLTAALQLYFFTRYFINGRRILYLCIAVALAALASLIRPIGSLWIVPCIFLIMIIIKEPLKKRLAHAMASVAIFAAILCPWMLRNSLAGAGFRIDTNIGDTLLYHNCAVLKARASNSSPEDIRQRMITETAQEILESPASFPDENSLVKHKLKKAKEIISTHPIQYAKLHFNPMILAPDAPSFLELTGMTQSGRGTFDVLNREGILAAVRHYFGDKLWLLAFLAPLLAIVGITYAGFAIQLFAWLLQRSWFMFFFFLAFIEYYILLPGPICMPRYHLPALPLMCAMAALTICKIIKAIKAKRAQPAA